MNMSDPSSWTPEERAEQAFQQIWHNMNAGKTRLRSLNERDKEELKTLMKTILLSSMGGGGPKSAPITINLNTSPETPAPAPPSAPEVDTDLVAAKVEEAVKTQMGALMEMLKQAQPAQQSVDMSEVLAAIKQIPASGAVMSADGKRLVPLSEADAVELHDGMFGGEVETNIDDVKMDTGSAKGISDAAAMLRKMQGGAG